MAVIVSILYEFAQITFKVMVAFRAMTLEYLNGTKLYVNNNNG